MNINLNSEKNGIELIFEEKPSAATLEEIKAQGFRWHRVKKLWYAKQTADRLTFARTLGELAPAPVACPAAAHINMEGVGCKELTCYGADLAKLIREDLKSRGAKGVTVRASRATHTTVIKVTVKATAKDFASIEEAKKRFNLSHFVSEIDRGAYIGDRWLYMSEYETMTEEEKECAYDAYLSYQIRKLSSVDIAHNYRGRSNYWELTTAFYNRVADIYAIANQWNYDHSDSMTDYFDVGYYLDIELKKSDDFTPRAEMTDEERSAYDAEIAEEIRKQEEAYKAYQEEQERARIESEKYKAWAEESKNLIDNDVVIEDLNESSQIYITALACGCGKESTIEEVHESINEYEHINDALITRTVKFTSKEAFERFSKMLLHDFDFLAGTGGTASEDVRLDQIKELFELNQGQRDSVKFYSNNCVAVYLNDAIQFVIDAQGYNYARYVYMLTDDSEIITASAELTKQCEESKEKEPFYFPAAVDEQINNISIGDEITIYQCDGWMLNSIYAGSGVVIDIKSGKYAQYNGVYIELQSGRGFKTVFIKDNKQCLIYKGIKPLLPEHVTHRRINDRMIESFNYDILFPNVYAYYKELGELPIIDTWQR